MARNGWTEAEARARIAAQMPLAEKRARADVIIDNSGTLDNLRQQVLQAYQNLKQDISIGTEPQSLQPPSLRGVKSPVETLRGRVSGGGSSREHV